MHLLTQAARDRETGHLLTQAARHHAQTSACITQATESVFRIDHMRAQVLIPIGLLASLRALMNTSTAPPHAPRSAQKKTKAATHKQRPAIAIQK